MAHRLRDSEKLHRYMVESSPDLVHMLNSAGCFTYINSRVESLLGHARDAMIGRHYSVLAHGDDLPRAHAFAERRTGERASSNVELRLAGRRPPCRGRARPPHGGPESTGIYTEGATGQPRFAGTYGGKKGHQRMQAGRTRNLGAQSLAGKPGR
jgi:PAS domain S-box-containing protein